MFFPLGVGEFLCLEGSVKTKLAPLLLEDDAEPPFCDVVV